MSIRPNNIFKNKNPIYRLGFFLFFIMCSQLGFAGGKDTVENKLTVVRVIPSAGKAYIEINFSESQRFYKLLKKGKHYAAFLELLKWSEKTHVPVIIQRRSEYSDTIISVKRGIKR